MSTEKPSEEQWDIAQARELYGVNRWGLRYFDINEQGVVTVAPLKEEGISIPILEVAKEAREQGLHFPMLIRFHDLLRNRVARINRAFSEAIAEAEYRNQYRGVYPVKVNQLREVVEEILDAGHDYHHGLEVGSKPELHAALALHEDPDSLIVCNGYKDEDYVRVALIGRKLGKKVILVVEKVEEIRQIIAMVNKMKVEPLIGFRVRLMSGGKGKWAESGGENAKFGLSTIDIMRASRLLQEANMAHCLKLVHFHIGSQVPDILTIKKAVREGAMFYAKLSKLAHPGLEYLDVGGGLGVDYDGSRTTFHSSINYSLNEYARDVIYNIMDVCDAEEVAHPVVISESGRALVAHHSLLVVETFGNIKKAQVEEEAVAPTIEHKLIDDAWYAYQNISENNPLEAYHDAQHYKSEAQTRFELGMLDLEVKAEVERIFWLVGVEVLKFFRGAEFVPDEIVELESKYSDQYLCNFSVFQSLLDHWGFGQLFPIMPLHRLDEEPQRRGTLADITCDSDGVVSRFINLYEDGVATLPLHELNGKPYYLGIFLTGAYQDIMGDLHNLFGRVNEAHVYLDEDEENGYYIEETIPGTTMEKVLALVQYSEEDLGRKLKRQFDRAIREDRLRPNEAMRLLNEYNRNLKGYTYLRLE
ncbi:biosynthetic arginine decarboxylase [Desulfurivibrio alkaliphilus]|uniref:Arginine decarboxylase n=1 Tax=Desulfurivibrio alkaliphilus (strain DSM 19089 / UNIQEM U267 / AHT2) TaxID=589865 RepID=D6Z2Z2_DESAT|nr:biosynthetic arginine decarboxylase [Desulfurivibrio alkaliphilus]ADH85917.1 arginine decarboxylase [Desulfurivibrio alkaliphilus AHT 2]